MAKIATAKIEGVFTTYGDGELRAAATSYYVGYALTRYAEVLDEIKARQVPLGFADERAVTREFARVREAARFFDSEIADPGTETRFSGDYAVRSVGGSLSIGFRATYTEDGNPIGSGYVYLAGPDRVLYFVESADEIGDDLGVPNYAEADRAEAANA